MKKITMLAAVYITGLLSVHAQYPASLPNHVVGGIERVTFKWGNCFLGDACNDHYTLKTEIPPWIIPGGWRSYFIVNGTQTHMYSTPQSLITNSEIDFKNDATGPTLVASPYRKDPNYASNPMADHWRRIYHNIYTAQYYVHPVQGGISIGYANSENKNYIESNDCGSPKKYPGSFNPTVPIDCSIPDSYSNLSKDGYLTYHAMVTGQWTPNVAPNWGQQYFGNALGPVTWPANGYIASDWRSASQGCGGPSSIIANGYIYIYYLDVGPRTVPLEEGRGRGIRALRVLQENALDASKYEVFYKDPSGLETWNPAIPAGLTKDNMLSFLMIRGSKGSDILNNNDGPTPCMRFSVAKVANTNYYAGIEEYADSNDPCNHDHINQTTGAIEHWGRERLALRFSYDLVNWSDRIMQIGASDCFDYFHMRYPIFLNSNGWTNTEIDLNDFYVLGCYKVENGVNKIRVRYVNPNPPTQPPWPPRNPIDCNDPHKLCDHFKGRVELQVEATVFPNPSTALTKLRFVVPEKAKVTILLYDANGKIISRIEDKIYERGTFTKELNLSSKSAGIYFVQVKIGDAMRYLKVVKP
jgi:hypothetical protein